MHNPSNYNYYHRYYYPGIYLIFLPGVLTTTGFPRPSYPIHHKERTATQGQCCRD